MRVLAALALAFVAGCAQMPAGPTPVRLTFPEMQRFDGASPGPATRANSEIAYDFMDLAFKMESGWPLPVLTRFEGPITLRVKGNLRPESREDLAALLRRLRNEAGIDIRQTTDLDANIVIEALPNRTIQRVAPNAACFVVPRVQSWAELRSARNTPTLDWANWNDATKRRSFCPRT